MKTRWLRWICGKADLKVRLYGVRLYGVRLYGVRLYGVRLYGVRLYGVRLHGAALRQVGLHRLRLGVGALALIAASVALGAQRIDVPTRALLDNGIDAFLAGRVDESVAIFDRVVKQAPDVAPDLWQRGIALYYVGRYKDCRAQFESHRTVNPNDVENPAWHFLCVARAESPARAKAALLPVGPDQRSPMREVYQMFQGTLPPEKVIAAGAGSVSGQFFAELYVGLYYEATGDKARALQHLKAAADERFARAGGYMHVVARLHPMLRR